MKMHESGMPDSWRWEEFFDPLVIIHQLDCTGTVGDLVEFGCGYGTFTFPVAKVTNNTIHAFDIDPAMVSCVKHRAEVGSIPNILTSVRDLEKEGTGIPEESVGHAMLFNILYAVDPLRLLREAYRILAAGGVLSVLNWRTDIETPCGPPPDQRPTPGQCFGWAARAGFHERRQVDLGAAAPWHYGQVLLKSRLP